MSSAGGKAAALARAAALGLPTLPGVVVTTGADLGGLTARSPLVAAIRRRLGDGSLVARSSSPIEDTDDSAMAGQFATTSDLDGDEALAEGILEVARSGRRVAEEEELDEVPPVAVLVQPMIRAAFGGVCFGVDPVTGRDDRKLAVASTRGPDPVVSGEVDGVRHLLDRGGHLVRRDGDRDPGAVLGPARCSELAALADRLAAVFGHPQDLEFLVEDDGTLRLLQSRPVTTEIRSTPSGPVYGTGPVAETFPDPLSPLEQDLWVLALTEGMREALALTALASAADLRQRSIVTVIDGWVAADLDLIDPERSARSRRRRLNPAPFLRRARATWRVGRLRAALPGLARDLTVRTDDALSAVGSLHELSDRQLVALLHRGHVALRALHGHEILMGLLSTSEGGRLTGVSVALRALAAGRSQGLDDDEIIARSPVVLALTGPRIDGVVLPSEVAELPPSLPAGATDDEAAVLREALRLRVRWVQELTARAAGEIGSRLAGRGALPAPDAVAELRLEDLVALVTGAAEAPHVRRAESPGERRARARRPPARFRLDDQGRAVPLEETGAGGGTPASGGVGRGPACFDAERAGPGAVLVVAELRPELAPHLSQLAGLVAETGSPLAHLAILAREAGVPTVVALSGATSTVEDGQAVEVDGDAGTLRPVEEDP